MKSRFFLISFFLCLSLPAPVFAQDNVPLRASERDGYSRLILGWKKNVKYTLSRLENGKLIATFERGANINPSLIDFSKLDNIASLELLSKNPLKLAFVIPKSSDVRDFKIGSRVVFDIYDPKDKSESFPLPPKKEKPKEEKPRKVKLEELKPAPPAIVLVPEKLAVEKAKPQISTPPPPKLNKKLEEAVKDETHVISVQSIKSVPLAVFESYGDLWVVLGGDSDHVLPALNSPKAELFSKFKYHDLGNYSAYKMSLPDQPFKMKAKGGGLVWDIIMGANVKEQPSVKMNWSLLDKTALRSGKLFIPLENIVGAVDANDPITGQVLKIITVSDAPKYNIDFMSYVDFDILRSPVGLAVRPKVDDLQVKIINGGVEISRPSGLAVASLKDIGEAHMFLERAARKQVTKTNEGGTASNQSNSNFFRFNDWAMGDASELNKNENILLSGMNDKSDARKVEDLLALGKMFISHGRGAEALGYFNYAEAELPRLSNSAEFIALRGLSKAMDWKSDAALNDLSFKGLDDYDEVKYWKSYVLADLGDWRQAASILPDNYKPIYNYPEQIANRLALALAEVNLRDGKVAKAKELMSLVESHKNSLFPPQKAALKYLQGEAYRQNGKLAKTMELWEELAEDKDDLYRTKSRLALAILLENEGKIKNNEVIDRLERLRYAWRGDELEAQVHYLLGKAYFKSGNFVKGLAIMRDAASVAGDTALGRRITSNMSAAFSDFFLKRDMKDATALDAVTIYEQFSELTPVGSDGDLLVQKLAEHMVRADLLGRATKLLRHQVNHRLKGLEKIRVAIRLAAIELIDKNPQRAMNALGSAASALNNIADSQVKSALINEIALLKIRAYSQNKQYDKALSLLENIAVNQDVNRLRADVAWQAGYWEEAADALGAVIVDEHISMTRPLSQNQQSLILNRAIALSLANDRIALANMRKKFSDLMLQTNKSHQFEVITRPRHSSSLANRQTLLSIVSEVDLFKNFLDSYRSNQEEK